MNITKFVTKENQVNLLQKIADVFVKWQNWKLIKGTVPPEAHRCVFVFAPHTSNWDWFLGTMVMNYWRLPMKVAIKDVWHKFPFGMFLKPLGALAIDRSSAKGLSQVDKIAKLFETNEKISFVITPEGTRKIRERWKTGFFHIANKANVPIVVLKAHFKDKTVEFGPVLYPAEGLDTVMTKMMKFYANCGPVYPELFSLDQRYV